LSLPVYFDPALSAEVEALTREIIGTDADPEKQQLACRIAEAQIDLRRATPRSSSTFVPSVERSRL
jgi:hypothetical protein